MDLIYLSYVFFKIGLFGFGGGYGMISLIQHEVVDNYGWMTSQSFADILAISQMTPGPISINTATYVGYTVAGLSGSIIATLALCLPSILMMFFVIRFLFKHKDNKYIAYIFSGLKPAVAGLILAAALLLMNKENFSDVGLDNKNISIIICASTFMASLFWKVNPMILIAVSGVAGFLLF